MGNRERPLKPGEAQARRARFCVTLLGLVMGIGFLSAATIGIASPGIWNAFFVPTLVVVPFALLLFIFIFTARWAYLRLKARHYGALLKLQVEAEYNPLG